MIMERFQKYTSMWMVRYLCNAQNRKGIKETPSVLQRRTYLPFLLQNHLVSNNLALVLELRNDYFIQLFIVFPQFYICLCKLWNISSRKDCEAIRTVLLVTFAAFQECAVSPKRCPAIFANFSRLFMIVTTPPASLIFALSII